jgi:RNA recognition motif-containing protein
MLTTLIIAIILLVLIIALWAVRRRNRLKRAATAGVDSKEAMNKQVYVGNLPYQVTENDLKEQFKKYGVIDQVRIVKNYSSGRSKGFGFVTYRSVAEARNALVAHGQKYKNRTIVVRIAKPR